MGAILMPQALLAAYKTVPESFQIHHLTSQFFHPGLAKWPLKFEVIRTNDSKNQTARTVHLIQNSRRIASMTMSFIRKPLVDNLSLSYQSAMPRDVNIPEPDETINDLKNFTEGILQAEALDMVISE
jgi:acyl-CoA thioesterase-2